MPAKTDIVDAELGLSTAIVQMWQMPTVLKKDSKNLPHGLANRDSTMSMHAPFLDATSTSTTATIFAIPLLVRIETQPVFAG